MTDKIQSSPPMLLRPSEAARALGLHPQTLANLRHEGRGPCFVKLGAAVRYDADALREYCAANTKTQARRAG
jgi:hypothetical protein